MSQKFNWDDFWYVYEIVTGMEPKYRKDFEEEVEKEKKELIKLFGSTKVEIEKEIDLTLEEQREIISTYIDDIEKRARKKGFSEGVIGELQKTMMLFLQLDIDEKDILTGYITKKSQITKIRKDIAPGMKISKVLRILLKEKGLEEYAEFLIQDLSILQGQLKYANSPVKIVVSLEPLDFFLASNATTGWKTCHSIVSGTHAAGNLSYLFDSHTVVAYAYRKNKIGWGLELPQKMWRQWIFIDVGNAIALFQKQYPTEMLGFEKEVYFIVGNALRKYHNTEKNWTKKDWDPEKEEPYFFNEAELAYSDNTETYIYFKGISPSDKDDWYMTVGEIPLCPVCGGELDMSDKLVCSRCAGYVQCARCSKWVSEDDIHYGADHYPYCEECYDTLFINCAYCGEIVYKEDAKYTLDGEYICESCFDEHFVTCAECGKTLYKDEAEYVNNEPYCNECYLRNFTVCSSCGSIIHKVEARKDVNGSPVCEYCAESSYVTCEKCGKLVSEEDAYYIEDSCFLCPRCYKKHKKAAV